MREMNTAFVAVGAALLLAPAAADELEIMSVTDAAAPVPGKSTVRVVEDRAPGGIGSGGISQMPGWPRTVGGNEFFSPQRGLVLADLVGDAGLEVIVSSTDNKIHAWDLAGNVLPGFPVSTVGFPQYAPSVADLDGDGDLEIVQATRGPTSGGRLYALDHQGQNLPGFPLNVNNNNLTSCPTLADLDGNGDLEILVGERDYPIGYLHAFNHDGTELSGWPVTLDHVPASTASVGDVDDDGSPEVFYLSYASMYLIDADGSVAEGWPRSIPDANFSYQSAALADLDGDDDLEIVVGTHGDAPGTHVFHHDGAAFPGWPFIYDTWSYCPPTVSDLEGDGALEIINGWAGNGFDNASPNFWVWDVNGNVRPGFPFVGGAGGGSEGPLTTADINGDGVLEIFVDSNIRAADTGEGYLFGVDKDGNALPGFPLRPLGFTYLNGAMIEDVDGDGDLELGVLSTLDTTVYVNLYDLPDQTEATPRDWVTYHAADFRGGFNEPAVTPGEPAGIIGVLVAFGVHVAGDAGDLLLSDDAHYRGRSRVGFSALEPNLLEVIVQAQSTVPDPSTLRVQLEERYNQPIQGTSKLRLRDWSSNAFHGIDTFTLTDEDQTHETGEIDAGPYVNGKGRIDLSVKHVAVATFSAIGFDSFFDLVEIRVE